MELLEGFNWLLDLSLPLASPPRDGSNDAFLSLLSCALHFIQLFSFIFILLARYYIRGEGSGSVSFLLLLLFLVMCSCTG